MARFRHTIYPSITYSVHGRLYQACAGILEVPDADLDALWFFRQHSDAQHGILIELPTHSDPPTACPQCRAQFPTLDALRSHIQHDHGTPLRSQRAELQTLASAQALPSKAAGVVQVEYRKRTGEGLRHAALKGLRPDQSPRRVVQPTLS